MIGIFRTKNLIFIGLIQVLMSKAIIQPILKSYGFNSGISTTSLSILVLSTILLAAAGYVINDYFDVKIDSINNPENVIIGKKISKKSATLIHQILSIIGCLLGIYLALSLGSYAIGIIYLIVPGLLWFYSSSYKRLFIIGNIVIAILSSLSILLVSLVEIASLHSTYQDLIYETNIPSTILCWVGSFSLFAFMTTFLREIIKDIQDEKGDRELECRTMPIVWGIKRTKFFLYILISFIILLVIFLNLKYNTLRNSLSDQYLYIGIITPLFVLIYLILKAKNNTDYEQASNLVKFTMFLGSLYSLILYFLMTRN